ncbi:YadA-like family protein [Ciceribacter sp. S95]|nr:MULTISPECIES: YadA-like family protein [unclassified Ciceribacter]
MGIDTVALGTTTTSSTGENAIAVGGGATASAPSATAIGTQALASGNASIAMGQQANATGSGAIALGQGAAASNAGDVALGSGSATQTVVNTAGTTINGHDYVFAGATATSTVSVGDVGAERTVTNVGAGRITASSTDAINGSQLFATNQSIDNLATEIGEVAEGAVLYDTNADGTRANSVTLIGGDPSAPVLISNVAAGVADTDAVNVGQLNEGLSDTLTAANTYTDQVAVTTLNEANNYTDYKFDQLNQDIGAIRSEARQAAAIGLAAASLRYDDRPGKLSAAVGGGIWRGEGALAFGAGYTSEDGRLRTNLSATTAGGHWGAGAGLSYTFN